MSNRTALDGLVSAAAGCRALWPPTASELSGAVHETAGVLREIASRALGPGRLDLPGPGRVEPEHPRPGHLGARSNVLDPVLVHLRPAAIRLSALLRAVLPAAANEVPTIRALRNLLPGAEAALEAFPAVERVATPAVESLTTLLRVISPSLSALRPYAPDVVAGFFNGVGGATGGSYDANGHYLHGELTVQGGGSSLTGLLNLLGRPGPLARSTASATGLLSPCPGEAGPRAVDKSNPWNFPDVLPGAPTVCNPKDDQR